MMMRRNQKARLKSLAFLILKVNSNRRGCLSEDVDLGLDLVFSHRAFEAVATYLGFAEDFVEGCSFLSCFSPN
jgi:hypothetical protein